MSGPVQRACLNSVRAPEATYTFIQGHLRHLRHTLRLLINQCVHGTSLSSLTQLSGSGHSWFCAWCAHSTFDLGQLDALGIEYTVLGLVLVFVLCESTMTLCLILVNIFLCAVKYKNVLTCVRFRVVFNFVHNCTRFSALLKHVPTHAQLSTTLFSTYPSLDVYKIVRNLPRNCTQENRA